MKKLTETENAVLNLVKYGYENHEIAAQMFISNHTVKAHISSILTKVEARNRTQLVYFAMKANLID